jgi:clan AA aspartic protease (TIGR02281 family)
MVSTSLQDTLAPYNLESPDGSSRNKAGTRRASLGLTLSIFSLGFMGAALLCAGTLGWWMASHKPSWVYQMFPASLQMNPLEAPIPGNGTLANEIKLPIPKNPRIITLDAMVNQQEKGSFLLDTGATYTAISTAMAHRLKLDLVHAEKMPITTANGTIYVPKVVLKTIRLGNLEAHNVEATVMDLSSNTGLSGLLGLSFLEQFELNLHPNRQMVTFRKSNG